MVYLASPAGRHPPTPFRLIELDNSEHDFPQRIIYWRDGDTLHARIEGTQDGKPQAVEWQWQLVK